jgi:opacity protein-like surface antigen
MKKILCTHAIVLGASLATQAQEIADNAIGLRIGDGNGFGTEISYQRALGGNNRLELDLGIRNGNNFDGFQLAGLYQWVWNIEGGFNWYAGVGGGLASYSYDSDRFDNGDDSQTFIFAAGDVGIEYNFDIPLILSLDVRPEFGFGGERHNNNDLGLDIALGIRYQF